MVENQEDIINAQREMLLKEAKLKSLLRALLTSKAYERLSNVRIANPELYAKAVNNIISMYAAGYIKDKLTEDKIKIMLKNLSQQNQREIRIRRK